MSRWVCSGCNHSNNSHAKYCIQCGEFKKGKAIEKSTVTWLCPICKEENSDSAKYCRKCGHWLLSENYTPKKVEKGAVTSPQSNSVIKNKEAKKSKTTIIEVILIGLLGIVLIIGEGNIADAFPLILGSALFVHLPFSIIYIVKAFLQGGFIGSQKAILKHGALLVAIFVVSVVSYSEPDTSNTQQVDQATAITNAVELEYEDLLRNAEGKYKNLYVKVSGKVYHLENGNQKNIMIDMSTDPLNYQAVYVKRNEQDINVIINDNVVIYGIVTGTVATTNIMGAQAAVPVIESHSLILQNKE